MSNIKAPRRACRATRVRPGSAVGVFTSILYIVALRPLGPYVDRRPLGRVRLWRDDITMLVNPVHDLTENISMTADGYQLDTVDDLTGFQKPSIDKFVLRAQGGRVRLELSRDSTQLEVQDPDLETRGLASEIERMLASRGQFSWRLRIVALPILTIAVGITGAIAIYHRFDPAVFGLIGVAIGSLSALFMTPSRDTARIYTKTRAEAPPWLERNRDGLITNAIVSVVFYLLGTATPYLISLLGSK